MQNVSFKCYKRYYDWYTDNSVAALIPELWAMEALREFRLQTVALPFVNRDYQDQFA